MMDPFLQSLLVGSQASHISFRQLSSQHLVSRSCQSVYVSREIEAIIVGKEMFTIYTTA